MSKRVSVKVEKGAETKPSPTTKMAWRVRPGTATYPQPIKFEGRCEDLKGFVFNCSGVSNSDEYSTSTKEVVEYIGRKFIYGVYIHRSLENEMKTRVPLPMSLSTRT